MLDANVHAGTGAVTASRGLSRFAPSIYQVALAAIMGAIFIVALAPRLDTDFWWHLKDGQYITSHLVVPSRDFMSYTMTGHPWTDHEWLAEIGIWGSYSLAGLWGPIVLFAFAIAGTFAMLYGRMRLLRIQPVLALFVMAMSFMASSASWGPRIQMITLFFLSAYLLVLDRFRRSRNHRLFILFPVMMLFWANIHGGFVLGPVVLGITVVGEWLNRRTHHPDAWTERNIKMLTFACAASFAVTIVNPNTYRQLLYPLTFVLPNAYTNLIQESASPNFHLPVMMLFEAMLLLLISAFFIARPRVNWTHLFMVLAFTHLALSQVRNVAIWAVVIGPLVAVYLQASGPALGELFPRLVPRRRPVDRTRGAAFSLLFLVLLAIVYPLEATHFVNANSLRQAEDSQYPSGAIAYMKSHQLPPHVFASYNWGGYLLWNTFPRYRDYMDSRADTLYNDRILSAYIEAYAGGPHWRRVLNRYSVGDVLIEPTAPLAQLLTESHGWKQVYRDSVSVLFTRRT